MRAFDIGDTRFGTDVTERTVAPISEKVTAPFSADDEQVEPAVVVVVGESGVGCASWQYDVCALGAVAHEPALHAIEMNSRSSLRRRPRRYEQIVGSVAVDI